jgi:hypothetical protein
MINNLLTKQKFNYDPTQLAAGSKKTIIINCDYCQENYETSMKICSTGRKKLPKDCCKKCRYKKREEVSLKNFGVKNSAQTKEVREKLSQWGKEWFNSEEYKQKNKETNLKKYGTDSFMKTQEGVDTLKRSMKKKYGVDNIMKIPSVAKEASEKAIKTRIKRGMIQTIDGLTLPEKAKEQGLSRSHFGKLVKSQGVEEALLYTKSVSSLDQTIMNYLDTKDVSYETQFRLERKIADIKVGNVIIECDGLHWHSDSHIDKDYHKIKMEIYKRNGYTPLFFRGDEIIDKLDIVLSILNNKIGLNSTRVFARKTECRKIDYKESQEFIKHNHLMGVSSGITCGYGLFLEDELISVIQFKKNKDNDYEISRYCNKLNTTVVGGFSKLIKAFERSYEVDSLSTFIDLRYGQGDYLGDLGFVQKSCHLSFKWTNTRYTYHRMKFPSNTGYEQGMNKIWDCGQAKWVKYAGKE